MCEKELGLRLKSYILKEGYTVTSFAKMLGVERNLLNKAIDGTIEVEESNNLINILNTNSIDFSTYPYEWLIEEDNGHWVGDRLCLKDSDEYKYLYGIGEVEQLAENIATLLDKIDMYEYHRVKRNELKTKVDLSEVSSLLYKVESLLKEKVKAI